MVSRRELLKSALAFPLVPGAVAPNDLHAQEAWPARTITIVVPFPPGGTADFAARPFAAHLAEKFQAYGTNVRRHAVQDPPRRGDHAIATFLLHAG